MVPRIVRRVVPFLIFAWIAGALVGVSAGAAGLEPLALNTSPPATPQKLIFIHHSTGGNWLADPAENSVGGDLGRALMNNNYFVSATNYGWNVGGDSIGDRTDIPNWWEWFRGPNSASYLSALYACNDQNFGDFGPWPRLGANPGGANTIVMFKSCFPNSNLEGNPNDPPVPIDPDAGPSWDLTVGNAKGVYVDILSYFATRQDKLFIVIVQPPLMQGETDVTRAANARALADWLVNDWLDTYPHHNVFVFDFFSVLTSNGGSNRKNNPNVNDLGWADGNHHRYRNGAVEHMKTVANDLSAYWSDDSHPSLAGNQKATGEYIPLLNIAYNCWKGLGDCPGGGGACTLSCTATVPATGVVGTPVSLQGTGTAVNCSGGVTYDWSFGDGTAHSSQQNPSHTYAAAGTYTWTLTVSVTGASACTQTGSITISASPVCTLACTATVPATGTMGEAADFQGTGTATNCSGSPTFDWDFGDGAAHSSEQNPSHTYAAAGTFTWTLTVSVTGASSCTQTGSIAIVDPASCSLSCDASATPTSGAAPLLVTFSASGTASNCTAGPTFAWTFGDGSTSTEQNPTHSYAAAGTYTWACTVSADDVGCVITGSVTVTGAATCTLNCTATVPGAGAPGSPVSFQATVTAANCTGTPTILWDFGDANTSAVEDPSHTYAAAGTFTWTLTVTADDQTCTQTGSIVVSAGDYHTYHVRTDGGDATQCTGLANAAYPGSGSSQPCAWNHPFQALPPGGTARIAGGDTLIIHAGSYMMGYGAPADDNCSAEASWDCFMVSIPSGPDSGHPTRILGEMTARGCTSKPELWGTERPYHILDLHGSSHVEVACLDITDHSGCIEDHNNQNLTCAGCNVRCQRDTAPFGDWAMSGISGRDSTDVKITDVDVHGLANMGIHAGRVSSWTLERVKIIGNGWSGWNGDLWEDSSNSGTITFKNVEIAYNGCAENYPAKTINDTSCWGQEAGGYGDGLGTAITGGNWVFEDCKIHHNTSDGLDLLYLDTTATVAVRRLYAEGSAGNQLKTAGPTTVENSVLVGNCAYFEGAPLMAEGDQCRALGSSLAIDLHRGNQVTVVNSTITGEGDCLVIAGCNDGFEDDPDPNCDGTERVDIQNTLVYGNTDWRQPEELTCLYWYDDFVLPSDPVRMDYNLIYHAKDDPCPGTHDVCAQDPLLQNASLDHFDGHLTTGSPAIDEGTPTGAPAMDYENYARTAIPDIGAYEYRGAATCTLTCTASAAPASGVAPLAVTFTATATASNCTGSATFAWTFGDGQTSTEEDPGHTYAAAGTYTWTLTVTVDTATCTQTGTVTVTATPTCTLACTATAETTADAGHPRGFSATATATGCTGTPTFDWDFGDGTAHSTEQNPGHTYETGGTFTWTLTVTVDGVTCTQTGTIVVTACVITCSATVPATAETGVAASFEATGTFTGCPESPYYRWNFGDGNTAEGATTTHLYSAAGTYTWTLSVSSGNWTCTQTGTISVTGGSTCTLTCTATAETTADAGHPRGFSATATATGCAGTPNFDWDFGDGTPHVSSDNTTHTYEHGGTYTWTLTVTVDGQTCTRTGTIVVSECIITCAATVPATAETGTAVSFEATSTLTGCDGTANYAWNFGDGNSGEGASTTHLYSTGGTYTWTLTVSADGETCMQTGTITIGGGPTCTLTCTATATPATGPAPLDVAFSGTATATNCLGGTTFAWNFGDGTTSAETDTTHTYAAAGTYTWTLAVTVDNQTCSQTGTVTVTVPTCTLHCNTQVPTTGVAGIDIIFTGYADMTACTGEPSYLWTFGEGSSTSTDQWPRHTYASPGTYTWTMTATVEGVTCTATGTIAITAAVAGCGFDGLSVAGLQLVGDAAFAGGVLLLTPAQEYRTGAAWCVQNPSLTDGFTSDFRFRMAYTLADENSGADGLAFVVHNADFIGASALGTGGEGLGFSDFGGGVAVEFDTYQNEDSGDPNANHLAVMAHVDQLRSNHQQALGQNLAVTDLSDGAAHHARIVYAPGILHVYLDDMGQPALSVPVVLQTYNIGPSNPVWVGFTGAAGGAFETHEILDWTFTYTPSPACTLTCNTTANPASGPAPHTVNFNTEPTMTHCTGTPTFEWDFGDGTTSTEQLVSHTYTEPGSYTWSLTVSVDDQVSVQGGTITVTGSQCTLACEASVPATATAGAQVPFQGSATPTACTQTPSFSWNFGDGHTSNLEDPAYAYPTAGTYTWTMAVTADGVTCTRTGQVVVSAPPAKPGDCDGNGTVSIGEVQKAINMFLGILSPPSCGVDCNGDGVVSIGELQKVINGFLGLPASC